jgi:hypothetical protein
VNGREMEMQAAVCSSDGGRVIRAQAHGPASAAAALGGRVAELLTREGAMEILDAVRGSESSDHG